MAARTQTIVVAQPARRSAGGAVRRRSAGGGRRGGKRGGASPTAIRERSNTRTLTIGGISALAFGLVQRKVKLPGIPGIPNSLTYGTGTIAVGLLARSDTLLRVGTGPFFAGLHNLGLKGLGQDTVGYSDDATEGEFDALEGEFDSTEGEFDSREEVTAGDFDDL